MSFMALPPVSANWPTFELPRDEIETLQLNLVRSHSCGIGDPLSEPEVRAMMLLRANVLALGLSGIRPETVDLLCEMLNHRVHPVVPEKGSVGASGDLAPLAHLALGLIGEGEVFFDGKRMPSADALKSAKLKPTTLAAKEGLALLNGTQAMHAVGGLSILRAKRLSNLADVAGAMTLEGLRDTPAAFDRTFAGCATARRPESRRGPLAFALGKKRDPRISSQRRPARAGRLQHTLHAAGPRRSSRCSRTLRTDFGNRIAIGHRQSARLRGN